MNYDKFFEDRLKQLENSNLLRKIPDIEAGANKYVTINNRKCLNLASNNYLGLSLNERLKEASKYALLKFGCSSSASRVVTGNYSMYDELERAMAEFKGYPACVTLGCGYVANVSVISAICDRDWMIFSDRLNHASIIDGARLSLAKHVRFQHNDMNHLETLLKKYSSSQKKFIVSDTVFSMDGDLAKLNDLVYLTEKYSAMLMVDEAHATGIFGNGSGLVGEFGLQDRVHLSMGTFSKALGSFGAYVCSSKNVINYLVNKMRGFIFSTSLPPCVVGANLEAVRFLKENSQLGRKLLKMAKDLRDELDSLGFDTLNSESQIIPVIIGNREKLMFARDFLIDKGIFVAAIRPPTVPQNTERLRISLRVDITDHELNQIFEAFKELAACL